MKQGYKNIRRLHRIVATLIKYGFGTIVAELNVVPFFSVIQRLLFFRRAATGESVPVRIRLVLEELGPTFIKFGQVASTRADLLPHDWVDEFKKLQDMVPPAPFADIKAVVERSLKGTLEEKFATFDEEPVASASIAQVHLATLKDGREAAVKVKRPKIGPVIEADIAVMYTIAGLFDRYVPAARRYRPFEVVKEFSRIIHMEQDMSVEAGNFDRFGHIFADEPRLKIPEVYWELTTDELLTMERISGTPMDESELIRAKGLDIRTVALDGLEIFFKQVFEHGIFHADLHPGNIFVRDDGVIIYLDFGIVGRLDKNLRRYLASMLYYLVKEDYYNMAVVHKKMGLIGRNVDIGEFEEALRDIAEPLMGKQLEHISVSSLLIKLIETARRFEMILQPNLLLLQKSMVIIEGVGRQLYPDINVWEVAKPLIFKWMAKEKFSPKAVFRKGADDSKLMLDTLVALPGQAGEFFDMAINDELKIGLEHHRLDALTDEIRNNGKRTAGGFLIGSLVLASSLVTVFSGPEAFSFFGAPVLGLVGYAISAVLAFRLWRIK